MPYRSIDQKPGRNMRPFAMEQYAASGQKFTACHQRDPGLSIRAMADGNHSLCGMGLTGLQHNGI